MTHLAELEVIPMFVIILLLFNVLPQLLYQLLFLSDLKVIKPTIIIITKGNRSVSYFSEISSCTRTDF